MSTTPYRFSQRVLFKLAWENMRKNSFRTLASLIGIILSCGLLFGIIGTVWSLSYSMNASMVEQRGSWHVSVYTNECDAFEALLRDKSFHIEAVSKSLDHGVMINSRKATSDYVLTVQGLPQNFERERFSGILSEAELNLAEGRIPAKAGEILLPYSLHGTFPQEGASYYPDQSATILAREPIRLGSQISVATGRRFGLDKSLLGYFNSYQVSSNGDGTFTETVKELSDPRTFTVVGFVDDFGAPAYVSADEPAFKATPLATYHIALKNIHGTQALTSFVKSLVIEDAAIFTTSLNNYALFMSNIVDLPQEFTALMSFAGILSLVVMFAAAALISNTFTTSMNVRIGQFGLLRSLGATRAQLLSIIVYESLLFAAIGIPLGLLLGALATHITFVITEPFWIASASFGGAHITLHPHPMIFAIPALLTLLLIFLSSSTAATLIWKTSPLQTMRIAQVQASNRKINRIFKKRGEAAAWFNSTMNKPRGIIARCFGTIGFLAQRNLKLNSSKARTLQAVLLASVLLFLIGAMLNQYISLVFSGYKANNSYDFSITISEAANQEESFSIASHIDETLGKLKGFDEISEIVGTAELRDTQASFPPEMLNPSLRKILNTQDGQSSWNKGMARVSLVLLGDDLWHDLQKHLVGSTEMRKSQTTSPQAVIYNRKNAYNQQNNTYTPFEPFVYTDKPMLMHVSDYAKAEDNEFDIELVGFVNTLPEQFVKNETTCASLMHPVVVFMPLNQQLPANMISALSYNGTATFYGTVASKTATTPTILKARDAILEIPNAHLVQVDNISKNALAVANSLQILRIYLGLLTVILSIIAVINVFNGVTSALILRSKEFASLLSMGMTMQGLLRVVFTEYLTIIFKGVLYASLATFGLTLWFNRLSQSYVQADAFFFPVDAFLIAVVACLVTLVVATAVAFHHTKVMNLSENLKSDLQ